MGKDHNNEYARRGAFYFKKFIKIYLKNNPPNEDEMLYLAHVYLGSFYEYLNDPECVNIWKDSEKFCPDRNEHIINLALYYEGKEMFSEMLEQTSRLMDHSRKMPFPKRSFLVLSHMYYNTGDYVQELHERAFQACFPKSGKKTENERDDSSVSEYSENLHKQNESKIEIFMPNFNINKSLKKKIFVADNFYENPMAVREFALQQDFENDLRYYKGKRTHSQIIFEGTKEAFQDLMGMKITNWAEYYPMCGRFQSCTPEDAIVYHTDNQRWAGMIYLTPDAPPEGGTATYRHKETKADHVDHLMYPSSFEGGFYDGTKFETVDIIGNVFNRLVIFDAMSIHSAYKYFGKDLHTSRLFHMFFFD